MTPAELPVLVDEGAGLRLRPWRPADGPALVEAWATPDIAGRARAGEDGSAAAAARWIAGSSTRAAAGLAVDLVIGPVDGDEVWGEVGLVHRRLRPSSGPSTERTVWELGWWVHPSQRGRGLAVAAARRFGPWAAARLGVVAVVARIEPDNAASQAVAGRIGLTRRGRFDAAHELWAGPVPRTAPSRRPAPETPV